MQGGPAILDDQSLGGRRWREVSYWTEGMVHLFLGIRRDWPLPSRRRQVSLLNLARIFKRGIRMVETPKECQAINASIRKGRNDRAGCLIEDPIELSESARISRDPFLSVTFCFGTMGCHALDNGSGRST